MRKALIPILTLFLGLLVVSFSYFVDPTESITVLNVQYHSFTPAVQKQVRCLAQNIYFESAYEPDKGKIAVAFVTLNRTKHNQFPSSICEVVTQKTNSTCQFSWFCQEREKATFLTGAPKDDGTYQHILQLASFVYANQEHIKDPTNGAIYYHADYVNPQWKNVKHSTTIGRHIFYTEKVRS